MKKIILVVLFLSGLTIKAQLYTGELIKAGLDDGPKLVKAYLTPLNKGLVFGLQNTEVTSFKQQEKNKKWAFSVRLSYILIPSKDKTFDVTQIGLTHFEPKNPGEVQAQTVFGDSLKHITLISKEKDILGRPLIEFETPGGLEKAGFPLPAFHVSYTAAHTAYEIQFIPYVTVPQTQLKTGMLGLYIHKDLLALFGLEGNQSLGLSAVIGGSVIYAHADLDVKPGGIYSPVSITGQLTGPYDNQRLEVLYTSFRLGFSGAYFLSNRWTASLAASVDAGSMNIQLLGRYPVYATDPAGVGSVVATDVDDPLKISGFYTRLQIFPGIRYDARNFFFHLQYHVGSYGGPAVATGVKF